MIDTDRLLGWFGLVRLSRFEDIEREYQKAHTIAEAVLEDESKNNAIIVAGDHSSVDGIHLRDGRRIIVSPGSRFTSIHNCVAYDA